VAALLAGMLAGAVPAAAAEPPTCWNPEVWARPDVTRTYELYCPRTVDVELVSAPTSTRFEGLVQGERVKFRLTPQADAPEHDELRLRLTGAGGSTDQLIAITNVPVTTNTAPRCDPASAAQRSDGMAPVTIAFYVVCWDDEHDDYTLYGNGPGSHPLAPLHNAGGSGGQSVPMWHYVPTIASGQEQTSYYAIDTLGARSANAPISVQLGPAVDRLPRCHPNPSGSGNATMPIFSRPGATRRFTIICEDPDGDALVPRLQTAPARGTMTAFEPQPGSPGWLGANSVWIDATYVPATPYEGTDPFEVAASGPRGDATSAFGIVARRPPANGGGGCGWSGASTTPATPVTLEATCDDDDGDPLTVSVVSAPAHGTVDAPVVTPVAFGNDRVQVTYRPASGFTGSDTFSIRIDDGVGEAGARTIAFTVTVGTGWPGAGAPHTIGTPFAWPELQPGPTGATWLPSIGQAAPVSPTEQARRALGTRGVRLVKRIGDARVYAQRSTLTAAATARRPALAVTCPVRCTVSSTNSVAGRGAGRAKLRVSPGKARALDLDLSAAQRARVRRAGSSRAVFRMKVVRTGRRTQRAIVRLALRC
jgi:hypothetical protein